MTREEWHEHLREATGPLALDRIGEIQPEPELWELLPDVAQPPWPEEPDRFDGTDCDAASCGGNPES